MLHIKEAAAFYANTRFFCKGETKGSYITFYTELQLKVSQRGTPLGGWGEGTNKTQTKVGIPLSPSSSRFSSLDSLFPQPPPPHPLPPFTFLLLERPVLSVHFY